MKTKIKITLELEPKEWLALVGALTSSCTQLPETESRRMLRAIVGEVYDQGDSQGVANLVLQHSGG